MISSGVPLPCVHLPSVVPSKWWDLDSLNLLFLCFSFPSLCSSQGGLWKAAEATPVAPPQSSRSLPSLACRALPLDGFRVQDLCFVPFLRLIRVFWLHHTHYFFEAINYMHFKVLF